MAESMELDLTPVPVEPETRRSTGGKLLLTLALVVASVLALIGAGVLAWNFLVYHQTDRGSCLIFDPSGCRSLSLAGVEEAGNLSLPEGSRVLDSGSGSFLLSSESWAVVELPVGAEILLDGMYVSGNTEADMPPHLIDAGFASVDQIYKTVGSAERRTVIIGTGADGGRLAHIQRQG